MLDPPSISGNKISRFLCVYVHYNEFYERMAKSKKKAGRRKSCTHVIAIQ